MGGWDRTKKRIQSVNRWISGGGAFFLIPLMLLTTAEVIGRSLFNRPIAGAVELSEYLLSIFILMGLAYAQQVKAHVNVTMFISRLSYQVQVILNLLTTVIGLLIFVILAWQGFVVGIEERTVSDMLRVPQTPFRLLVSVAAFLTCLELLIDLGEAVKKLGRRSS